MNRSRVPSLFAMAAAVVALTTVTAPAQAQEFTRGVRPGGMGEAFTAVSSGTSAIYHNPAGVARTLMYAIEGGFEYTPEGNILSASVVDSKTNPSLGAGVGYSYFFDRDDELDIDGHDIRLGLALPVVPDRISIGVGGRYLIVNRDGTELMNGITLDAGVLFRLSEEFHLGLAGRNLIDQCERDEFCAQVAPTEIAGGIAFGSELGLIISGDVAVDLNSTDETALNFDAGAEYFIQGMVPIRAGYLRRGALGQDLVTFGAGWRSSAAGVDLSYQLDVGDTDNMYFMGSFSIFL